MRHCKYYQQVPVAEKETEALALALKRLRGSGQPDTNRYPLDQHTNPGCQKVVVPVGVLRLQITPNAGMKYPMRTSSTYTPNSYRIDTMGHSIW